MKEAVIAHFFSTLITTSGMAYLLYQLIPVARYSWVTFLLCLPVALVVLPGIGLIWKEWWRHVRHHKTLQQ